MATTWNGSVALLADQTAVAYAEWVQELDASVHIRMSIDQPELVIDCQRQDRAFSCEHEGVEQMVSVEEYMASNDRLCVRVRFKALVAATSSVTFSVVSGEAVIENCSLVADEV